MDHRYNKEVAQQSDDDKERDPIDSYDDTGTQITPTASTDPSLNGDNTDTDDDNDDDI